MLINFGYTVSDSFIAEGRTNFLTFSFGVWEFPDECVMCGGGMSLVQWSITSDPNGGTVYGYGDGAIDKFISVNQYGYDIDLITVTSTYAPLTGGTKYWLNLSNAAARNGGPVYWDENSGEGCGSPGCPSQAYQTGVGMIPSEAFTLTGCGACGCEGNQGRCTLQSAGSTPEPGSIVLFVSGVFCLAGLLRRKLSL